MSMAKEFREFASRGNVIDLAVGVIIGAAFSKIVTSLVSDIVMPPIGKVIGGADFKNLFIALDGHATRPCGCAEGGRSHDQLRHVHEHRFVDVLIVAFVIFLMVQQINRLKTPEPKAPAEDARDCPSASPAFRPKPAVPAVHLRTEAVEDLLVKAIGSFVTAERVEDIRRLVCEPAPCASAASKRFSRPSCSRFPPFSKRLTATGFRLRLSIHVLLCRGPSACPRLDGGFDRGHPSGQSMRKSSMTAERRCESPPKRSRAVSRSKAGRQGECATSSCSPTAQSRRGSSGLTHIATMPATKAAIATPAIACASSR